MKGEALPGKLCCAMKGKALPGKLCCARNFCKLSALLAVYCSVGFPALGSVGSLLLFCQGSSFIGGCRSSIFCKLCSSKKRDKSGMRNKIKTIFEFLEASQELTKPEIRDLLQNTLQNSLQIVMILCNTIHLRQFRDQETSGPVGYGGKLRSQGVSGSFCSRKFPLPYFDKGFLGLVAVSSALLHDCKWQGAKDFYLPCDFKHLSG